MTMPESPCSQKVDYPVYALPMEGVTHAPGRNLSRHCEGRDPNSQPLIIYHPLGQLWVAIDVIAHKLNWKTVSDIEVLAGHPKAVVMPPKITERTKALGVLDAPEMACFPLKATIGYFEEALMSFEQLRQLYGSAYYPLLISHESTGTCRERVYGRIQEARLQDFSQRTYGHADFDFYVAKDSMGGIYETVIFFLQQKGAWENGNLRHNIDAGLDMINLISEGIACFRMAEGFERVVRYSQSLVARERHWEMSPAFYRSNEILQQARVMLASALPLEEKKDHLVEFENSIKEVTEPEKKREEPRGIIAITGEIFHNEEMETVSADIGTEIAKRGYYYVKHSGIDHYVDKFDISSKSLAKFILNWITGGIPYPRKPKEREVLAARGGLTRDAGGHSKDVVALVQKVKEQQKAGIRIYNGIIELLPFGCVPEIVTASILDAGGFAYLRLMFDEQTGKAGAITRLEAYLDKIGPRRARRLRSHGTTSNSLGA